MERAFLEVKYFEFCLKERMRKSKAVNEGLSEEEKLNEEDLLEENILAS